VCAELGATRRRPRADVAGEVDRGAVSGVTLRGWLRRWRWGGEGDRGGEDGGARLHAPRR
jgi:hypothetical protein